MPIKAIFSFSIFQIKSIMSFIWAKKQAITSLAIAYDDIYSLSHGVKHIFE